MLRFTLSSPWFCLLDVDVPMAVFGVSSCDLLVEGKRMSLRASWAFLISTLEVKLVVDPVCCTELLTYVCLPIVSVFSRWESD